MNKLLVTICILVLSACATDTYHHQSQQYRKPQKPSYRRVVQECNYHQDKNSVQNPKIITDTRKQECKNFRSQMM